jgi:tetratricopeptide (TPR) repeat protein
MSVVFSARDLKHDRPVAIKVLRAELTGAIGEDRFHREIEVAANLAHPHIMPLHDSGSADGMLYFVMPLVEGESLRAKLDREGALPIAEAIRIAREVAEALAYSHRHGVVHRDVKPENIMLADGHALLMDFGIARLTERLGPHLTSTGLTIGTPAYMSPEQASGESLLDGRSDIYSLGCVLFEMVAGAAPYGGPNARALLTRHLIADVPSLDDQRPDAPPALTRAVERALAKDPDDRFATAEELATALVEARNEATSSGQTRPRWIRGPGPREMPWVWTVPAAAVILLFFLVGPRLWEMVYPPTPAYAVEDPRGSYVILPSARAQQTAAELDLVVRVADWMALRLGGLESVRVVQEPDMRGAKADLGVEGPIVSRIEDGIRVSQALRVGTLITVTLRIVGDTAYLEARQYDAAEQDQLGLVQSQAAVDDPDRDDVLVGPVLREILEYRGEEMDPGTILRLSRNLEAHQEYNAGRRALNQWRLEEAERHLREAIAQDSTFALPHYLLALTLYWQTTREPDLMHEMGSEIARLTDRAVHLATTSGLPGGYVGPIEAFGAFWAGDYDRARRLYDSILAYDPTSSEAWLLRGAVEFEDPWARQTASGDVVPRSNLNLAKRAFEKSVDLARDLPMSYGLLFQIDGKVVSAAAGWGCPAFLRPGGKLIPPWQAPQAEDQASFCPLVADSIQWIPWEEFTTSRLADAKAGAARLYDETSRTIQMWTDYAPDQPRPHEEWSEWLLERRAALGCEADPARVAEVTDLALVNKQIELELKGDTTPVDRVRLANLLLTTGANGAAESLLESALREPADSVSQVDRQLPAEAANLYLATGRPSEAIAFVAPASVEMSFAFPDPRDESYVSSGNIQPTFSFLEVLGATGFAGPPLERAFEELDARWSAPEYTERERAVLHLGALPWLDPALLLSPGVQRAWFGEMEAQQIDVPLLWQGLLAADQDPVASERALEQVSDSLPSSGTPSPTDLFLAGVLAERLGRHELAADLFTKFEACPASVNGFDPNWGLQSLALLHRARSLEMLGQRGAAARAYREFADAWHNADPGLQHLVSEARAVADRLAPQ